MRKKGTMSLKKYVGQWKHTDFKHDLPNAVIVGTYDDLSLIYQVMTLVSPHYDAGKKNLSFKATLIGDTNKMDKAHRLYNVGMFVDNVNIVGSCWHPPFC